MQGLSAPITAPLIQMAAKLTALLQMLICPQAGPAFLLSTLIQRKAGLDTGLSTSLLSLKYPPILSSLAAAGLPKAAGALAAFWLEPLV
jgi:hypothetical protein